MKKGEENKHSENADQNPFSVSAEANNQGNKKQRQNNKSEFVRTSQLITDSDAMYEVREIPVVAGAEYDALGFYNLPDGSFYDPDGHYFD